MKSLSKLSNKPTLCRTVRHSVGQSDRLQKNIEEKREMFEKMVGAVKREILQDKTNRAAQNARKRKVQTRYLEKLI